ncbi:MAG: c-type cytochrome [Methyloversatilis sp.]|uniref:c-type cytochrome n=1 Tax=Methyloversatilis sp. TaxID=2569862 RepID=UPI0025CD7331|nr:c-type cytochrome [Methyloversatilis sp.]MCR6665279.1 c-type cytochrome [Methyloversatilis sp.]
MKRIWIAAALFALPVGTALAGAEDAMKKAGCTGCHSAATKMLGPTYKDISAKYKGQDVSAALIDKVRKGGKGNWGAIPMPPHAPEKIGDAELKEAIAFILGH